MRTITYNGKVSTAADLGIKSVQKITRQAYPGAQMRGLSIPGLAGIRYLGKDRNSSTQAFRLWMTGDTYPQKREYIRKIVAWLDIDDEASLVFSDEPDKRYMAVLISEINPEEMALDGFLDVAFLVPSSYAEAVTPKTVSVYPATNAGTAPAPCKITATVTAVGGVASLRINLLSAGQATGEFVLLSRALSQNNVVVIDTQKRIVTVNGVDARVDVGVTSKYFKLPPGQFSFTTAPSSGISIQTEYRELWK